LYNPNFEALDRLHEEGYLRKFVSSCGRLFGYNYTDKCVYDRHWNKHTLNARGTVYEKSTGKVVARAFPKFFNFEELAVSKQRALLKEKDFYAFWKEDGSLGVMYFYDGDWHINTRGSFNSEQAVEAEKIMEKYDFHKLDQTYTYLVEIVYPENRIIMDYGDTRQLVMLTAIHTSTGVEMKPGELQVYGNTLKFPVCDSHQFDNIDQIIQHQQDMGKLEEGYVVLFQSGERVKFKSKEYMKLAALMSHMTPLHFWKNMVDGRFDKDFLEQFPEEVRPEADEIATKLVHNYLFTKNEIIEDFVDLDEVNGFFLKENYDGSIKKYLGLNLDRFRHPNALFLILDNNEEKLDKYIMKRIRPKANEL